MTNQDLDQIQEDLDILYRQQDQLQKRLRTDSWILLGMILLLGVGLWCLAAKLFFLQERFGLW